MKRFVTYLYEYKNGHKMKNIGFLRIDIRNQMVTIQISMKHQELAEKKGICYLIVRKEQVYGIALKEIFVKHGQYNGRMNCRYHEIGESPFSMKDAIGMVIRFEGDIYVASSWNDKEEQAIEQAEFLVYDAVSEQGEENMQSIVATSLVKEENVDKANTNDKIVENEDIGENTVDNIHLNESITEQEMEMETILDSEENISDIVPAKLEDVVSEVSYRKINLSEIHTLPRAFWHYSHNSFLMHGFWNYGYLIVKEEVKGDEKNIFLGVPGIFEYPEQIMATHFGFPDFVPIEQQERNTFGYWLTISSDI